MAKSITELQDEKKQLRTDAQALIDKAQSEKRQLTSEENSAYTEKRNKMLEIDLAIDEQESIKRMKTPQKKSEKEGKFSFVRAIRKAANRETQDEVNSKYIAEGDELQKRAGNVINGISIPLETRADMTASANHGTVIQDNYESVLLPLEAALVVTNAGARLMTGLSGNVVFPTYSGNKAFWEAENASAEDGAGTFDKIQFTPKRLAAYVDLSKQLLVQENVSVENLVRQYLTNAISQKLESTLFGSVAESATQPAGLFAGYAPTDANTLKWSSIVAMESAVDTNNALTGNLAYIMHPTLTGKAKATVKDASGAGGFVFGNDGTGLLNGYKALRSTNMASGIGTGKDEYGCIFGNWADLFIGQWGALDLIVDPYTKAGENMLRIVINGFFNFGKLRSESFSIGSFK